MGSAQLLVSTGDFTSALDVVDELRRVLRAGDVRGLHCFRHLPEQIDTAAAECDRILTGEFLRQVREREGEREREREREREGTWWAHTGAGNALAFKQPT
jgi:hypothetical protein